jgi:drug/metabolite transporter (DMT)-like permease
MSTTSEKTKGVVLMVLTCLVFAANVSVVKLIRHIDPTRISYFRFAFGFIFIIALAWTGRIKLKFKNTKLLLVRGLLAAVGISLSYLAVIELGVSKGMILVATYPIYAYIFSVILIREKPSIISAIAILTAFFGIYLVITGDNGSEGLFSSFGIYELLAASVGIIGGLVIVIIRKLHQSDSSYAIYYWQCMIGVLVLFVPSKIWQSDFSKSDIGILLLVGTTATIGQLMMTQSYKFLPIKTGATLMMLEPVFCYIAGVAIFQESLTVNSGIGSAIIIASCVAVVLFDDRAKIKKSQVCKNETTILE